MSLVDYSSSEDEIETATNDSKLTKEILPNPFNSAKKEILDDCSQLHNGRKRTFAHDRGIWATYVYISYPRSETVVLLQNALKQSIEASYPYMEVVPIDDLHLSLSRTVILRHHWIDGFTQSVKDSVADVKSFSIFLNNITIVCNDEGTRTFICLEIDPNIHSSRVILNNLVQRINQCLDEFNLPPFYENAMFHVSILWCLGNRKAELEKVIDQTQAILDEYLKNDDADFHLHVDKLHSKIGNKLFMHLL